MRTRSKFGLGVGLALIAVVAAVAAVFFPSARAVLLIYALIMAALAVANIREARKAGPPRDRVDDEP
ncbi:MAG: hypothetical protein WA208_14665 [Thermoanaerobaculia bacterium]